MHAQIPLEHGLAVAGILFCLGLAGLLVRRNILFVLMSLEVIAYAGAIMVLFVFVVMMLNLGPASVQQERAWLKPGIWLGPILLGGLLLAELLYVLFANSTGAGIGHTTVDAKAVGISLFGPYLLVVELASMLLLAAAVTAFHVGRNEAKE